MNAVLNPFTGRLQLLNEAVDVSGKANLAGGNMFTGTQHIDGNVDITGNFIGDGSLLTGIDQSQIAGLATALAAKLDKAGGTMTGALTINAGTLATAAFTHQQTWNSAGTTCRGMEVKVTDTASAMESTAFRVCTGASGTTERFVVQTDGTVQIPGSVQIGMNCITQYLYSRAGYIALGASDNAVLQWIAADTIGMKRSTNAQKFRVFGDGTKYAQLEHDGTNAKLTASGGNVHISNLPTSNPGPGILWNNAGTPAIGT